MTSRLPALSLFVLATACGDGPRQVAPSSVPPSPPAPASEDVEVTGTVYESTVSGRRPLANVNIDISVEYQSWPATLKTDADGRYRRQYPSRGPSLKLIAAKEGYSQPCRVPIAMTAADQDVYLVANQVLAATGIPSSMPVVEPTLTGLIFERTANGIEPVVGASVVLDFSGGMGWAPSATTTTDSSGRYLLCNVIDSTRLGWYAFVSKLGYGTAYVPVTAQSSTFDLELRRVP